jgi:hypothetical protein
MTTQASREDRFFGVSTTVDTGKPEDKDKLEVVIEGAEPVVDVYTAKAKPVEKSTEKAPDEEGEDGEQYSERVKKRIAKLTWEREEAKRGGQQAQALRDEAIRAAQALNQRNMEYQNIITNGEAELVQRVKYGAAAAAEVAKAEYRKAYETGDSELMLAAHERLINAQAEQIQANQYDQNYQSRRVQQEQHAQQHAQQQAWAQKQHEQALQQRPVVPNPTPEAQSWAERNSWFNDPRHRDMTAIAYATHETLIRDRGFKPDSPAYYEELDTEVRRRFPDYFEQGKSTVHRPATVVAAARRDSPTRRTQVKLNETQVALAKKLGIPLERYASEVLKGMENV